MNSPATPPEARRKLLALKATELNAIGRNQPSNAGSNSAFRVNGKPKSKRPPPPEMTNPAVTQSLRRETNLLLRRAYEP